MKNILLAESLEINIPIIVILFPAFIIFLMFFALFLVGFTAENNKKAPKKPQAAILVISLILSLLISLAFLLTFT